MFYNQEICDYFIDSACSIQLQKIGFQKSPCFPCIEKYDCLIQFSLSKSVWKRMMKLSIHVYILGAGKYPKFNIISSLEQKLFNWQLLPWNIAEAYVRIMCIFLPFIDSCLFEDNGKQSMLDLYKENTAILKKKHQGIFPTTILSYLVIHNSFLSGVYMEYISDI